MTIYLLIKILIIVTGGSMIMTIVAVRDKKCDCFSRPFFAQTPAAAMRSFIDEVNREHEENAYNKHPEDYALYELGAYNDADGSIKTHEIPKLLIQADQTVIKGATNAQK